ncbi:MAG: hypothetical protein Q9M39_07970 [Sulfurovum sp.]|nr:hypothetical protein [Sulfurovum sp.]
MRKIIRNIFGIVIFFGILFIYFDPRTNFNLFQSDTMKESLLDKSIKSKLTYLMFEEQWLTFEINSFVTQLKFMSTVNFVSNIDRMEDNKDIYYSLKYEFLDKDNLVLDSKIYHMKTSFAQFVDANKTFVSKFFYLDTALKPNISQSFFISLKNHRYTRRIRLKIKSKDPRIVDIGIRSYFLEEIPKYRQDITWERMSKTKKKHLARGNIYGTEYMRKNEKDNLVSSLWKPNGPLGVEKKDYQVRRLYILTALENVYPYKSIEPDIYADINLSGARHLLKGKYDITFRPMSISSGIVTLKYYVGKILVDTKKYDLDHSEKTIYFESKEDGLLEIVSTTATSIELKDNLSKEPLTLPPIIASHYYQLDVNHSIEYAFYAKKKRYVRVECRSSDVKVADLSVTLKDKDNNEIKVLNHTIVFKPSRYDYIRPFIPQSEAYYLYIELPSNVSLVILSSSKEIFVRISTRSASKEYPIYSFSTFDKPDFNQLPSWFTLRPLDFNLEPYIKMERTLYKQPAIPHVDPFIKMGHYSYQQLFPEEQWRGHALLLKRPLEGNYIRSQSWNAIYTKVSALKKTKLLFQDDTGLNETTPILIYHHTAPYSKPVNIYMDNVLIESKTLQGTSGSIVLPLLSMREEHVLHFSPSENIDFFMSHTRANGDIYFKRNFIAFTKPLTFKIKKMFSEESIGFQFATEEKEPIGIIPIKMQLTSNLNMETRAYTSYTFQKYRFEVDANRKKAIHIAHKNGTLSLSEPMYLKLGENLPIGEYTITVYPPKTEFKNYLFMNHLILNTKAKIRISKETP